MNAGELWDTAMNPETRSLIKVSIADGKADIYPRLGPTSEWDIAAAQCIVEQAGGKVMNRNLDRLLYNKKESILNSRRDHSFDTKYFNFSFVKDLSFEDGVATLTAFTAKIIISAIKTLNNPEKIILCGGGRKNNFLVEKLKEENNFVKLIDEYNIDGDFIESQAFAYLAIRSYLNLPISFPQTTGVNKPCTGGIVVK